MTIDNVNKVPKKVWNKWPEEAREMFNFLYETSSENQPIMVHPKTALIHPDFWKTTAWNHAWLAAEQIAYTRKARND